MCGIGGILYSKDCKEILRRKIQRLCDAQKHRGPDGEGIHLLEGHAFCHRRLSLIDSEGGKQPFFERTGRYVMVYNGEIYNYLELREELSNSYQFTTQSDVEVVLAAYIIWGEECVHRFNGMFSFLIWDTHQECAFAARDPLGVKPFVYTHQNSTFIFASELKALLQLLDHTPEIDPLLLSEYLIAPSLSGCGEASIIKGVKYLEPGTYLRLNHRGLFVGSYYSFQWKRGMLSGSDLSQNLSGAIEESVRLSLRSESPVGLFLSGGLDSSLLAAIAAKHSPSPPPVFSITFEEHSSIHFNPNTIVNSDDLPYASELATKLQCPFYQATASSVPLSERLKLLAQINDRIPAWEQEFSQHALSFAARDHCKAVMVGDAADETHYGYYFLLNEKVYRDPLGIVSLFGGEKRLSLLAPHLVKNLRPLEYLETTYRGIADKFGFDFDRNGEDQIFAMNSLIISRWLGRLLHNGDLHTMHFGLEARVPFANRNVLEAAQQAYPCEGFKNGVEKYLLRKVASAWLPKRYAMRKKSALPRDPRLGTEYKNLLRFHLQEKNEFLDTYLDRTSLAKLAEKKAISENDRMILFNILSLIYWGEQYAK